MGTIEMRVTSEEAEMIATTRSAIEACGTDLSYDVARRIFCAMALARREGLDVRPARLLNGRTDRETARIIKRIRESMRFVWR